MSGCFRQWIINVENISHYCYLSNKNGKVIIVIKVNKRDEKIDMKSKKIENITAIGMLLYFIIVTVISSYFITSQELEFNESHNYWSYSVTNESVGLVIMICCFLAAFLFTGFLFSVAPMHYSLGRLVLSFIIGMFLSFSVTGVYFTIWKHESEDRIVESFHSWTQDEYGIDSSQINDNDLKEFLDLTREYEEDKFSIRTLIIPDSQGNNVHIESSNRKFVLKP